MESMMDEAKSVMMRVGQCADELKTLAEKHGDTGIETVITSFLSFTIGLGRGAGLTRSQIQDLYWKSLAQGEHVHAMRSSG